MKSLIEDVAYPAWEDVAHAAQLPPPGRWSTWLFQGGRGAGKTRAGAEWLAGRAVAGGRFALVGATLHDVRTVMIEGPSGLLSLPGRERPRYEPSLRRLVWESNGAEAHVFSADEPERLRGPQFCAAWADEFCTWRRGDYVLTPLRMGLRLGEAPQLVVTTTPKPIPALRQLRAEPTCVITQAPTAANAANLAERFLEDLTLLYGGTRIASQELDGVLIEGEGSLWRAESFRRAPAPSVPFERVVVAVDPPAGSGGSACGVVVAAAVDGIAYVLADKSAFGLSPLGWARVAAEAAMAFGADEIVAEANQGGDMVRTTLAAAGAATPVRLVRAAEGKRLRAEPVAALYERGRVVHAGAFNALEEELMALGVDDGPRFDRADALVWAVWALLIERRGGPRIRQL